MTWHDRAAGERALVPPALVDEATQLANAAGVNVRDLALALLEGAEGGMSSAAGSITKRTTHVQRVCGSSVHQ